MNRTELFTEVKSWLEAEKLSFTPDDEESFHFSVTGATAVFDVRLQCEDEPAMLQVICRLPLHIPKDKVSEAGLLLHNINADLRIGAFHLYVEDRFVMFRLPMPLYPDGDLAGQFKQALITSLKTMDAHLDALGLFIFDTPEARQALATSSPSSKATESTARLASNRLELN